MNDDMFAESLRMPAAASRSFVRLILQAADQNTGNVEIDLQEATEMAAAGPWVLVTMDSGKYAIWKRTGDVYRVGLDGAVEDEPIMRGSE